MGMHRTNNTLGLGRLTTALLVRTLDQHHTGFHHDDNYMTISCCHYIHIYICNLLSVNFCAACVCVVYI